MIYRIRDVVFSISLIILLSPLLLAIIIVLIFTQKNVFFSQVRAGKDGKPFRILKFSTLTDSLPGEEDQNQMQKFTFGGKLLRGFSLDELPQLFNVLKGDMSLIGPRPLYIEYSELYSPSQKRRLEVLPGITGWAQINGRNHLSFSERFDLDLWYITNRSQLLDLKILLKTPWVLVSQKGVFANEQETSYRFNGKN